MAINFTQVEETINRVKTEVEEFDLATQALIDSRLSLTTAQDVVASAQTDVTVKVEENAKEKSDVIAGISDAISQLNVILTELQV